MSNHYEDITIGLAGMLQAISLVRELTQTGKVDDTAFETCIYSIFQTDPQDAPTVFRNLQGIKLGLEKVVHTFDTTQTTDRLQSRYMLSLIHLQKKLFRSEKTVKTLTNRLTQARKQVEYFSLTHPTVISNLADIYLNTISTFKFRIVILGSQRILHVRENMEKVRALLLAGVRSATLWRQVGGSRIQILFSRSKIRAAAENLLAQINKEMI